MAVATSTITDASARFMNALVAMEPETENSGIYGNKPGYHNTRAGNIELDKTDNSSVPDYSIRAPLDLQGPSDKAAGYDWTHRKAQRGDYSSMAKYGDRLEAAFHDRDPRLYGWREALGQTDTDKPAEGLDFQGWFTRVPDSTHEWHWHFSELRAFVESWDNKLCLLSILKGESLADYLAAGGKLMKGAVMDWTVADRLALIWRVLAGLIQGTETVTAGPTKGEKVWIVRVIKDLATELNTVKDQAAANGAALSAVQTELAEMKELLRTVGVDPAVVQAAVRDAVGEALKAGGSAIDPA